MSSIDLLKATKPKMLEICNHFDLPCRSSWNKSNLHDLIIKSVDKTALSKKLEELGIASTAEAVRIQKQGGPGCDKQNRNDVINLAKSVGITNKKILNSNRKIICDAIAAHLQSGGGIPSQPVAPPSAPTFAPPPAATFAPPPAATYVPPTTFAPTADSHISLKDKLAKYGVTKGFGNSTHQKEALLESLKTTGGFIECDPPHNECADGLVCNIKDGERSNCVTQKYADAYGETKTLDHTGRPVVTKTGYQQAIINGKRVIGTKGAMDKLMSRLKKGGGAMPTSMPRSSMPRSSMPSGSHSHPSGPTAMPTAAPTAMSSCKNRAHYEMKGVAAEQLAGRNITAGMGRSNAQKVDLLCALDETKQVPCSKPDYSCPGDFVCDVNNNDGYCVTKDYANKYFSGNELYINGNKKVIGTIKALNSLKSKLKQSNIPFSGAPFTVPSSHPQPAPTSFPTAPFVPPAAAPTTFPQPSPTFPQPSPTFPQPSPTYSSGPSVAPQPSPTIFPPAASGGVMGDKLSAKQEKIVKDFLVKRNCLLQESFEELVELINVDCMDLLKRAEPITSMSIRKKITKGEIVDINENEEQQGNDACSITQKSIAQMLELLRTSSLSTPVGDIPPPVIPPTEPSPFVPPAAPFVPTQPTSIPEVVDPVVSPPAAQPFEPVSPPAPFDYPKPKPPSPPVSVSPEAGHASEADIEQILAAIQSGDSSVLDRLSGSRREVLDCLGLLG